MQDHRDTQYGPPSGYAFPPPDYAGRHIHIPAALNTGRTFCSCGRPWPCEHAVRIVIMVKLVGELLPREYELDEGEHAHPAGRVDWICARVVS